MHLRPLSTVSRGDYVNMYLVPGSSNGYAGSVAVANSSIISGELPVECDLPIGAEVESLECSGALGESASSYGVECRFRVRCK